jgi:hypothetical protein
VPSSLFFKYNTALGPPYRILLDTNFINFAIKNKLEIVKSGMDCLLAKVIPCVTDCVMAELEKLGPKYRIALRCARDCCCGARTGAAWRRVCVRARVEIGCLLLLLLSRSPSSSSERHPSAFFSLCLSPFVALAQNRQGPAL